MKRSPSRSSLGSSSSPRSSGNGNCNGGFIKRDRDIKGNMKGANFASSRKSRLKVFLLVMANAFFIQNYRWFHDIRRSNALVIPPSRLALGDGATECTCVLCSNDHECGGLWKAEAVGHDQAEETIVERKIHIVVSYCSSPLDWLVDDMLRLFQSQQPQQEQIILTIISKCNQEDALTELILQNETLGFMKRRIVTLTNVGGCDHSYAHWITTNAFARLNFVSKGNDKDLVVFLKDTPRIKDNIHQPGNFRSIEEMLRVTSSNGFVCGMEPTQLTEGVDTPTLVSAYHDPQILNDYTQQEYSRWTPGGRKNTEVSVKNDGFRSSYRNLGDFHRKQLRYNFPSQTLVQVCYGGSFAATIEQIRQHPMQLYQSLEKSLSRGDNIEEGHFAERTWAGLLAKSLAPAQVDALRRFSTGTLRWQGTIMGILKREISGTECQCVLCTEDVDCGGLWKAEAVGGSEVEVLGRIRKVHVVVAYCTKSLQWLVNDLLRLLKTRKYDISLTILSKCNQEGALSSSILKNDTLPFARKIVRLPNVGGCDHSYAHWMSNNYQPRTRNTMGPDQDVVIFIKDTPRISSSIHQPGRYRTLDEMLYIATSNGFACGMEPTNEQSRGWIKQRLVVSAYHDPQILNNFALEEYSRWGLDEHDAKDPGGFKSAYHNLADFHKRGIKYTFPNQQLIEVCYGGSFTVAMDQIRKHPIRMYHSLETILSRGDNIEEGHFVERTWASLLANPLTNVEVEAIRRFSTGPLQWQGSIMGAQKREYSESLLPPIFIE